jgi:hypothetical protein
MRPQSGGPKKTGHTSVVTTVTPESPDIPRAMVLTAYLRALPGDQGFVDTVTGGKLHRLDANLEASGPHDLASPQSRCPRRGTARVHRIPHPTFVTIAQTPLLVGRDGKYMKLIWWFCKSEYFFERGLTGF